MPFALCPSGTRANGAVLLGPLGGARGGDERALPCDEDGQRSVRRLAVYFLRETGQNRRRRAIQDTRRGYNNHFR